MNLSPREQYHKAWQLARDWEPWDKAGTEKVKRFYDFCRSQGLDIHKYVRPALLALWMRNKPIYTGRPQQGFITPGSHKDQRRKREMEIVFNRLKEGKPTPSYPKQTLFGFSSDEEKDVNHD